MNLFLIDLILEQSVASLCDKHVVKMIVESAQMLSTAHRMLDGEETKRPSKSGKRMVKYWVHPNDHMENTLYKAVHMGHPCTVWTMQSVANYIWHYHHFKALCIEYRFRYGKTHSTETLLTDVLRDAPRNINYDEKLTPFALAMTHEPQCIHEGEPVRSYQEYYQTKQDRFKMVWTRRQIPEWFNAII